MCVPLWKLVSFGTSSWQTPGQGTAWQTGAGSHPQTGAGLGCHHLCMETSPPPPPTCSGVCNLAIERLTLLLSYYHYIDFIVYALCMWMVAFLFYLCISTVTCFIFC